MPAKARADKLKPHTDFIVDMLARFRTRDQICDALIEKGVEAKPDEIEPFESGKYIKVIEKRRKEITDSLSIVKSEFVLMMLDELVHNPEASVADKMAALRLRTTMLKKDDHEPTAEELLRDAE